MGKHPVTRVLYWIIQLTWGILQNALGFLLWLLLTIIDPKRKRGMYNGAIVSYWKKPFSMGLGMFIFYGHENAPDAKEVFVHEYGHTVQSVLLGPLFVFVIGIPSLVWAFTPRFQKWRDEGRYTYMDFYPESWANKWGEAITGLPAPRR